MNTSSGEVDFVGIVESLIEDVHSVVDFVKLGDNVVDGVEMMLQLESSVGVVYLYLLLNFGT